MNISGSGRIAAGEYNEKISVSGSGRLNGNIRCIALSCSGSVKGDGSVDCAEDVRVSGSCHIEQDIKAKNISVSGALKMGGDAYAVETIRMSGAVKCEGSIKCTTLSCSGCVNVNKEIAAEEIRISGWVKCDGLMNAEKICIDMSGSNNTSEVGSIGCSEIKVYNSNGGRKFGRVPIVKWFVKGSGDLKVAEAIEGDVVDIEYVTAPRVVGRIVTVGVGCEIELLQYSESVEIHPKAKVGKCEKI